MAKKLTTEEWVARAKDRLLAAWDGSSGGTANCIQYAAQKGSITVINVFDEIDHDTKIP